MAFVSTFNLYRDDLNVGGPLMSKWPAQEAEQGTSLTSQNGNLQG